MNAQPPIIELQHLSKEFRVGFFRKRVRAVRDLSLTVHQGEIFGFLGPNGAGKTTTIKMLMGLIYPSQGQAKLFGLPSDDLRAKARLGFLPEHPYFYDYLTGLEFLNFYARLFGLSSSIRSVRVERLLEQVGLSHARKLPLRKYSKGMIQRVGIAQALINDPDLVILDEPMSGLDPIGRKDVRDIIFRLRDSGKTVFFSSHILQDVEMLCDRVAIVTKGQLRKLGTLHDLLAELSGLKTEITFSGLSPLDLEQLQRLAERIVVPGPRATLVFPNERLDEAVRLILQKGGKLESMIPLKGTLEDLFVQQVHATQDEPSPLQDEPSASTLPENTQPSQETTRDA